METVPAQPTGILVKSTSGWYSFSRTTSSGIGVSTDSPVPWGKAYLPPTTVSSRGMRVNIGAVGHSRSDSSSTRRT